MEGDTHGIMADDTDANLRFLYDRLKEVEVVDPSVVLNALNFREEIIKLLTPSPPDVWYSKSDVRRHLLENVKRMAKYLYKFLNFAIYTPSELHLSKGLTDKLAFWLKPTNFESVKAVAINLTVTPADRRNKQLVSTANHLQNKSLGNHMLKWLREHVMLIDSNETRGKTADETREKTAENDKIIMALFEIIKKIMDIVLGHYFESDLITELDSQIPTNPYGNPANPYGKPANVASVFLPDNANRQFRVLQKIIGAMWLDYYKNPTHTPFNEFYKQHVHFFFLCLLPYYNNIPQLIENAIKLALLPYFFESELDKHNAKYPVRKHEGEMYSNAALLVFGKNIIWDYNAFNAASKTIFEEEAPWPQSKFSEKTFNEYVQNLKSRQYGNGFRIGPNCLEFVAAVFDEVLSNEPHTIEPPLKRAFTYSSKDRKPETYRMPQEFSTSSYYKIDPLFVVYVAIRYAGLENKKNTDDTIAPAPVTPQSPSQSVSSPSSPGKKRMRSRPSKSSERGSPRLGGSIKRRHATYRKIKKYKTTRKRLRK